MGFSHVNELNICHSKMNQQGWNQTTTGKTSKSSIPETEMQFGTCLLLTNSLTTTVTQLGCNNDHNADDNVCLSFLQIHKQNNFYI